MPTIVERIEAARQAKEAAEQALKNLRAVKETQAIDAAGAGLRQQLKEALDLDTTGIPVERLEIPYSQQTHGGIFAMLTVEGIGFVRKTGDSDGYGGDPRVCVVSRCPNGHLDPEHAYPESLVISYRAADQTLLEAAERQAKLARPGGCDTCVQQGRTQSLRQTARQTAEFGTRTAVIRLVAGLVAHVGDGTLERALQDADGF